MTTDHTCPMCRGSGGYLDRGTGQHANCRTCKGLGMIALLAEAPGRVFILQANPAIDVSSAVRFGQPIVLFGQRHEAELNPAGLRATLRQHLDNFGDDDRLLLNGNPITIAIAGELAARASRQTGGYSVLKWDRLARRYLDVRVPSN